MTPRSSETKEYSSNLKRKTLCTEDTTEYSWKLIMADCDDLRGRIPPRKAVLIHIYLQGMYKVDVLIVIMFVLHFSVQLLFHNTYRYCAVVFTLIILWMINPLYSSGFNDASNFTWWEGGEYNFCWTFFIPRAAKMTIPNKSG